MLAVGQSRRDAALRSKRMRRSEGVLSAAEGPADAGQPVDSAAAITDAVAALAACRDVDSAQHLSALQTVRRLLSTGVHDTLLRHSKGTPGSPGQTQTYAFSRPEHHPFHGLYTLFDTVDAVSFTPFQPKLCLV